MKEIEEIKTEEIGENIPTEEEPSSFRLIMTLGIAGFFSGLLLVSVFLFTKPLIAENKARALEVAIYKVLPNATSFKTLELKGGKLVEPQPGIKEKEGEETPKIYLGFTENNEPAGFAIPAEEPGFQDIIGAIYGFEPGKKVIIGFEVLESKETPGLGDKIFKDADFKTNFSALEVEPTIIPVKKGEKTTPNQVETITGATISSKAIVKMLNNSIDIWKEPISEYYKTGKAAKDGN